MPDPILDHIAEELRGAGCTAQFGEEWPDVCGIIIYHSHTQNMAYVVMIDGVVALNRAKRLSCGIYGGVITCRQLRRMIYRGSHGLAQIRYALADPDSIPQIVQKVKELLGIKATSAT